MFLSGFLLGIDCVSAFDGSHLALEMGEDPLADVPVPELGSERKAIQYSGFIAIWIFGLFLVGCVLARPSKPQPQTYMYEGETVSSYDDLESVFDTSIAVRSTGVKREDLLVVPNGGDGEVDRSRSVKTLDEEDDDAFSKEE